MAANLAPPTREGFTPLSKPRKVDLEKGWAEDICLLGPDSLNGGTYPESVLRQHVKLYEDSPCNVDLSGLVHRRDVNADTPVLTNFGRWRDVRVEDGRLRANLKFNPKNAFAAEFAWAADNFPEQYGCSPVHRVTKRYGSDGRWVAESISEVFSVDIVSKGATTSTLYESAKMADVATPPDPRMIGAGLTTPDALSQFLTAMLDALPSGTFSDAEKASVLSQIMAKYEGAAGGSDVTSTAAMESLSRRGQLGKAAAAFIGEVVTERKRADRLKRAKDLCQAKGLPVHLASDVFVDTVAESIDNAPRAEALIADRLASGKPAAPADQHRKDPYTPPAGQPAMSVEDLVKQAVAGI
jgi:hypothetical protein